jgi:acyl-CoA reductase-like NAD-dependent aldehyde dehydrogenase
MKVADGFEPGAVIGPLIDMKAVEKVEAHIADALKKDAKVVCNLQGMGISIPTARGLRRTLG